MQQIHIIDGQKDIILDFITADNIIDDTHHKSLIDTIETYNVITFSDRRFSQFLEKRNRIIIPDEDGSLVEFVIFEAAKYKDTEGHKAQVFAHASYLELKKATVLYPDSGFTGAASQHGGRALNDTGWQIGVVEGAGTRTLSIANHTNPYEMMKRIAREFDLELKFRIEHDGNKVTGRYVDLLERVGMWRGREVEFGKDLDGIRRVEKQDIVTALLGIGPEQEDGTRLEVLVEDKEALQRWGRIDELGNLKHLIEPYEIQSERSEMSETEARQYTRTALDKRINTQVTFETTIVDLENVPGMENKKIRFGDTIKIKDTTFNPPLYLEARVFEQDRSIKSKAKKDIKLGDFIEHTEEEVNAIWKQLQKQIQSRVSYYEMVEHTYDKLTIDTKDETIFTDGKTFAEAVGIDAKEYAERQDELIKVDVKDYADTVSEQKANSALDQAKMYAVAKTVYDNQMQVIANDIADRAPLQYVDGKFTVIDGELDNFNVEIDKKADGDTVYTIGQVDNMINNTVSKTQYTTDMNGIVTDLNSHGTRLGQNETAIGLKADQSTLNAVENSLETKIGNVEIKADGVITSVSEVRADLDALEIGGRNILFDTALTHEGRGKWANLPVVQTDDIYPYVTQGYAWNIRQVIPLLKAGTYTMSVLAKEGTNSNSRVRFSMTGHNYISNSNNLLTDEWAKYSHTFILTEDIEEFSIYFLNSHSSAGNAAIKFTRFKLEKGTKATDWTPAPEDVDAAINQVSGRVTTLDGSVTTLAGLVELKASQSIVDSLEGRVSTAEGSLAVLPGQIDLKVSKDGAFGELNLSPDEALLNFNRVKMTGELEARHIKSLAGLNVNDQFIVDANGNVRFMGHLEGASGTFGDVTVTDGNFNLQDKETGIEYSATPQRNLIGDHSFELLRPDPSNHNGQYNWAGILPKHAIDDSRWIPVGTPMLANGGGWYDNETTAALPIFGDWAIVVRNANYVRQYMYNGIAGGSQYTVSGHFKRQWNVAGGGIPRIEIWHVDAATSRKTRIVNSTFLAVKNDYTVARHGTTFMTPAGFKAGDGLEIIISGGNDRWVHCDGVQMVEGDRPSVYQPEDSIWEITRGMYRPVSRQDELWTGAMYPNASQTITPGKKLEECMNGWILKWQAYVVGSGISNSNFEYTHIPKAHLMSSGTAVRVLLGTSAGSAFSKYVYTTNTTIVGHAANTEAGANARALTGVYEY